MPLLVAPPGGSAFERIGTAFIDGLVAAVPRILSAVVFLGVAYLAIKLVLVVIRSILERVYPPEQRLVVDLLVTVVGLFLWFGAGLAVLHIVGMGEVAASLGTAVGFIGLGIAFALKEMIADTVAGVYLLRDPDFNAGDRVETAAVSGTIRRIDLRKTRIVGEEGELIVLANRDVEKKWIRAANQTGGEESGAAA